ncbi:hypothetical protein DIPPA_23729 [Diplonema papillatum]|nr:hypothetical protein DIPPA_23729 [Diplonema papillatum]
MDPGNATVNPGGPTVDPGNATVNPGGPTMDPGNATVNPGGPTVDPGNATVNPGGPTMDPGNATVNPGGPTMDPGNATVNPGGPTVDPGNATVNPGGPTMDPGNATVNPGGPTVDPGNATVNPGGPTVDPGNATVNPGGPTMDPGNATVNPGGPTMDPGNATVNPGGPTVDPGNATVNPGGPTTEPGNATGGPGSGNTTSPALPPLPPGASRAPATDAPATGLPVDKTTFHSPCAAPVQTGDDKVSITILFGLVEDEDAVQFTVKFPARPGEVGWGAIGLRASKAAGMANLDIIAFDTAKPDKAVDMRTAQQNGRPTEDLTQDATVTSHSVSGGFAEIQFHRLLRTTSDLELVHGATINVAWADGKNGVFDKTYTKHDNADNTDITLPRCKTQAPTVGSFAPCSATGVMVPTNDPGLEIMYFTGTLLDKNAVRVMATFDVSDTEATWIGIGMRSGTANGMAGLDIAAFDSGSSEVFDFSVASSNGEPVLDPVQDAVVESHSRAGNKVRVAYHRYFDTGDASGDFKIPTDTAVNFAWARGTGKARRGWLKHTSADSSQMITLDSCAVPPDERQKSTNDEEEDGGSSAWIILLVLVLLCAVCACVFFLVRMRKKEEAVGYGEFVDAMQNEPEGSGDYHSVELSPMSSPRSMPGEALPSPELFSSPDPDVTHTDSTSNRGSRNDINPTRLSKTDLQSTNV